MVTPWRLLRNSENLENILFIFVTSRILINHVSVSLVLCMLNTYILFLLKTANFHWFNPKFCWNIIWVSDLGVRFCGASSWSIFAIIINGIKNSSLAVKELIEW